MKSISAKDKRVSSTDKEEGYGRGEVKQLSEMKAVDQESQPRVLTFHGPVYEKRRLSAYLDHLSPPCPNSWPPAAPWRIYSPGKRWRRSEGGDSEAAALSLFGRVSNLLRRSHGDVAEAADGQHSDGATGVRYTLHHVVHQDVNQHQLRHHVMVQKLGQSGTTDQSDNHLCCEVMFTRDHPHLREERRHGDSLALVDVVQGGTQTFHNGRQPGPRVL